MKVIQVVPDLNKAASGPSYSVPALCRSLRNEGCHVELHFAGERPDYDLGCDSYNYPVSRFPLHVMDRSPEMFDALAQRCKTFDIIHNNSLWLFPNIYPAKAKNGTKCKLVTAPRGTLAEWSLMHHRYRKLLFGLYAQFSALRATDMWHATCQKEYEEIREAGYKQPIAIVPIGMDLPEIEPRNTLSTGKSEGWRKKIAFFGRLHQVKAVDCLVLAWGLIVDRFKDWDLYIAGPDCGEKQELEKIVCERNISRVRFVGEIYGNAKYDFLASADLYVLPSHTENFAITVAEALACGTPVIASHGTPWSGLDANNAGWWTDNGVESLADCLEKALSLPDEELRRKGENGRAWICRDFSWQGIGLKMKMSYEWLLGKGDKPDCVVVD